MHNLFFVFLTALLVTQTPVAMGNLAQNQTGDPAESEDPVERAYQALLAKDDAATAEVDQWIQESRNAPEPPTEIQKALLRARVKQRLEAVSKAYQGFLLKHPRHERARMAYGSFLSDQGDEHLALVQWQRVKDMYPTNAAVWNNLANYYGHNGPTTNAFIHYEKAIALNPKESLYYRNFATTVYLFRKAARSHYQIDEPGVFAKAMDLYHKAVALDPRNFELATDVAQTYYGIKLPKTGDAVADQAAQVAQAEKALIAWRHAMSLARDDKERQGIHIHFARVKINIGRFEEASTHLNAITLPLYNTTKRALQRKMDKLKKGG